jgi:hypothetical protein
MHGHEIVATETPPEALPGARSESAGALSQCGTMEAPREICQPLPGVELATLRPFDTIVVRTSNSCYRIFVLDPETGRAIFAGGRHFVEPAEAVVIGSSDESDALRTGWIGVGHRIEAFVGDKFVRTSEVQSLNIEPGSFEKLSLS